MKVCLYNVIIKACLYNVIVKVCLKYVHKVLQDTIPQFNGLLSEGSKFLRALAFAIFGNDAFQYPREVRKVPWLSSVQAFTGVQMLSNRTL